MLMITSAMYTASVPVFTQMLTALSAVLGKAQAHVSAKGIEPQALLQARLFPDMFALHRQVAVACDFAQSISARLGGVQVPAASVDEEPSFEALQARIAQTCAFMAEQLNAAAFADSDTAQIVLRPGTPKERKLSGATYLFHYGLPQFFFHVTTAYDILRHNGVDIGKKDYMGSY